MRVDNWKQMGVTKYVPLVVSDDADSDLMNEVASISANINLLESMSQTDEVKSKLAFLEEELEKAKSRLEESSVKIYFVKGLTYLDRKRLNELVPLEMPMPPKKKVEVQPLKKGGKLDAENIHDEEVYNYDDPSYIAAMNAYEQEVQLADIRALAYTLVACVKGFDLSDEDIKNELGVDAFPKTPVENFRKRLDQIAEILLNRIDNRHLLQIQRKINELTGLTQDLINFT